MAETLGMFFKRPQNYTERFRDTVVPPPELSQPAPVDTTVDPPPRLSEPNPIAQLQLPPPLSTPADVPFEHPPKLSVTASVPFTPPPPLTIPVPPPEMPPPPHTHPEPVPLAEAPALSVTASIPEMPAPELSVPDVLPAMPAPALEQTEVATLQQPPEGWNTKRHSEDPDVIAAMRGNSAGLKNKMTSLDLGYNSSLLVPGIGMVPFNIVATHHGGDVHVSSSMMLQEAVEQRVGQIKQIAKDALIQQLDNELIRHNRVVAAQAEIGSRTTIDETKVPDGKWTAGLQVPDPTPLQPVATLGELSKVYDQAHKELEARIESANTFSPEYPASKWVPAAAELRILNDPDVNHEQKARALGDLFGPEPVTLVEPSVADRTLSNAWRSIGLKNSRGATDRDTGFFSVSASSDATVRASLPTDDEAYVPLVFTDLRPISAGQYRSIYFRPIIKSLSEQYSPAWNMQNFFGRVDKVATYQATDRTISLGFKVVTLDPRELRMNYQRLSWLKSMVYPEFASDSLLKAGPVVRMRVGDVVNAFGPGEFNRGVTGVITNLSVDYSEATWELEKGSKLPREFEVSLSFHVLHDSTIGRVGASFGGSSGGKAAIDRFHHAFEEPDYLNDPKKRRG